MVDSNKKQFDAKTEKALEQLHATALLSALGSFVMFRAQLEGEDKIKYTKVTSDAELQEALAYVSENGNNLPVVASIKMLPTKVSEVTEQIAYFALQRVEPDYRFTETLLARLIGKPVDSVEIKQDLRVFTKVIDSAEERRQEILSQANIVSPFNPWKKEKI